MRVRFFFLFFFCLFFFGMRSCTICRLGCVSVYVWMCVYIVQKPIRHSSTARHGIEITKSYIDTIQTSLIYCRHLSILCICDFYVLFFLLSFFLCLVHYSSHGPICDGNLPYTFAQMLIDSRQRSVVVIQWVIPANVFETRALCACVCVHFVVLCSST